MLLNIVLQTHLSTVLQCIPLIITSLLAIFLYLHLKTEVSSAILRATLGISYFVSLFPAVMPREKQSMKATTTGGTNSMKAILESDLFLTQTRAEICETSKLLASTQTTLTYAEIPFPLVCVIAHLYNINLDEFRRLWMLEKEHRCRKVLEVYKKDYLTTHFIERFGSKFLLHGYVGSEAFLTLGKQNESSTIMGKSRRPAPPPRDATVDDSSRRSKSASVRRKPSEEHRKRTGSIRQDSSD